MANELQQYIKGAIIKYELKVNDKYLKENILALEELKMKNGNSYLQLINNADNAKITALGIIKLSNKGLIFGKDFNIIPFKNKLTTIIDSKVYCKRIEEAGYSPRKSIIFKGEKFEWDAINSCPKIHEINFNANTSDYNEIIGAYAFAKDKNGNYQGILLRKADIDRLKNSSPSGNSEYSPLNKWPKEMVEAKLYRKLAQELGIDITDIDLDEKEIKEDGNFEYISFKDIDNTKNKGQISDEPLSNNINIPSFNLYLITLFIFFIKPQLFSYYQNLLKRKFNQLKPNRVWRTDVTVIKHNHTEKSNLISFIDLATRKVIAYTISDSMTTSVLIKTLLKAIATVSNKKDLKKLIIHSDQGSIYTATEYIEFCRKYKFKISYSAIATPADNAVQESFHARLKCETFYNNYNTQNKIKDIIIIKKYIEFYIEWAHSLIKIIFS